MYSLFMQQKLINIKFTKNFVKLISRKLSMIGHALGHALLISRKLYQHAHNPLLEKYRSDATSSLHVIVPCWMKGCIMAVIKGSPLVFILEHLTFFII